jgi:hypothetical protein
LQREQFRSVPRGANVCLDFSIAQSRPSGLGHELTFAFRRFAMVQTAQPADVGPSGQLSLTPAIDNSVGRIDSSGS